MKNSEKESLKETLIKNEALLKRKMAMAKAKKDDKREKGLDGKSDEELGYWRDKVLEGDGHPPEQEIKYDKGSLAAHAGIIAANAQGLKLMLDSFIDKLEGR